MEIGFEFTAATPKRLRAAEEQPVAQTMRGDRRITQAPSNDQKKARRSQQRKTANFDDIESIRRIASMPLESYIASLGDLTEIEVEAGIRDWWRARNTAFDPLKDSGLSTDPGTGYQSPHAPGPVEGTPPRTEHRDCPSCAGTGQNFHGGTCARCEGQGSGKFVDMRNEWGNHERGVPGLSDFARDIRQNRNQRAKAITDVPEGHARMAALNDVGDCRLCEGPLVPKGRDGDTLKAECGDCGTKHNLQNSDLDSKVSSRHMEAFTNLDALGQAQLHVLAGYLSAEKGDCPKCGSSGVRENSQRPYGHAGGGGEGWRTMVECSTCGHKYHHYDPRDPQNHRREDKKMMEERRRQKDHGRYASVRPVIALVASQWVLDLDTKPYLSQSGMSAIARRAQSVLDTEEYS